MSCKGLLVVAQKVQISLFNVFCKYETEKRWFVLLLLLLLLLLVVVWCARCIG